MIRTGVSFTQQSNPTRHVVLVEYCSVNLSRHRGLSRSSNAGVGAG